MVEFICAKCNFRFKAKGPERCPYCGNESVDKERSASEIIEEVSKILEE